MILCLANAYSEDLNFADILLNQNGRSLEFHKIQSVCHLDILWNHWNIDVSFFKITIFTDKINTYFHIPSCDYSVNVCNYICFGKGVQRLGICIAMNSSNQYIQLDKLKKVQKYLNSMCYKFQMLWFYKIYLIETIQS